MVRDVDSLNLCYTEDIAYDMGVSMSLFIAQQYQDDFHEAFVQAAMFEAMRNLTGDFFGQVAYDTFHAYMRAYLML